MSMSRDVRRCFPRMHDDGNCRQDRNHKDGYRKEFAHSSPPRPASRTIHCIGFACKIPLTMKDELPSSTSIGLGFEHEVNGFGFTTADGYFLRLIAVGFLPRGDRVLAGRQIGQTECSAVTRDGVVGILQ